jgi:hypothetical protein
MRVAHQRYSFNLYDVLQLLSTVRWFDSCENKTGSQGRVCCSAAVECLKTVWSFNATRHALVRTALRAYSCGVCMSSVTCCVGGGLFICFTCLHVPCITVTLLQGMRAVARQHWVAQSGRQAGNMLRALIVCMRLPVPKHLLIGYKSSATRKHAVLVPYHPSVVWKRLAGHCVEKACGSLVGPLLYLLACRFQCRYIHNKVKQSSATRKHAVLVPYHPSDAWKSLGVH